MPCRRIAFCNSRYPKMGDKMSLSRDSLKCPSTWSWLINQNNTDVVLSRASS